MRAFHEFCSQFSAEVKHVVRISRRYFHDPRGLEALGYDAFSLGLFLGEDRNGFRPTSALINLLAPGTQSVTVTDEAAWMFICGKDVLMEGVVEACQPGLAIVKDRDGNVLGYGTASRFDGKRPHKVFLKNSLDIGEYLRRETR